MHHNDGTLRNELLHIYLKVVAIKFFMKVLLEYYESINKVYFPKIKVF